MTFLILLLTRIQKLQGKWNHIMLLGPLELTLWSPNVKKHSYGEDLCWDIDLTPSFLPDQPCDFIYKIIILIVLIFYM